MEELWGVPSSTGERFTSRICKLKPKSTQRAVRSRGVLVITPYWPSPLLALAKLSEHWHVPVENLLSPDLVRRLMWTPPEPRSPEAVAGALRTGGAREWQVELTRDLLTEAATAA